MAISVISSHWRFVTGGLVLLAVSAAVSACSGSGGSEPISPIDDQQSLEPDSLPDPLIDDQQSSEPVPEVLERLAESSELIAPVPTVVHTETTAATGLQISYTSEALRSVAPALTIEKQWIFMQECLQHTAAVPLVLVREGPAEPFTFADDVVRNENPLATEINFVPIASATTLFGTVIQISDADFDGSLGTANFNLRSIMGRYIWLSNGLAERDYPFGCAREEP